MSRTEFAIDWIVPADTLDAFMDRFAIVSASYIKHMKLQRKYKEQEIDLIVRIARRSTGLSVVSDYDRDHSSWLDAKIGKAVDVSSEIPGLSARRKYAIESKAHDIRNLSIGLERVMWDDALDELASKRLLLKSENSKRVGIENSKYVVTGRVSTTADTYKGTDPIRFQDPDGWDYLGRSSE